MTSNKQIAWSLWSCPTCFYHHQCCRATIAMLFISLNKLSSVFRWASRWTLQVFYWCCCWWYLWNAPIWSKVSSVVRIYPDESSILIVFLACDRCASRGMSGELSLHWILSKLWIRKRNLSNQTAQWTSTKAVFLHKLWHWPLCQLLPPSWTQIHWVHVLQYAREERGRSVWPTNRANDVGRLQGEHTLLPVCFVNMILWNWIGQHYYNCDYNQYLLIIDNF